MRVRRWTMCSVFVLLLAGTRSFVQSEEIAAVPPPSAVVQLAVSRGASYAFPWSGVAACSRPFQPGCFIVEDVAPDRVVLTYVRVALEGGALKPQGFRYRTPVTRGGSPYELLPIKIGSGREEWVYAVLERVEGQTALVRFLKLPAFVTERARLAARLTVEPGWQRLREEYTVEADEPLTLIGLGTVDALFPSGRIEAIEINGKPVGLAYPNIVHFNLPAGRHDVRVTVALAKKVSELTIQGTLLEPRKMSLFQSLELQLAPMPGGTAPELEVRTVGLPSELWDRFKSTLVVTPASAGQASHPLAVRYRFTTSGAITLKALPRIPVGPNNYPLMITVTAPGPE